MQSEGKTTDARRRLGGRVTEQPWQWDEKTWRGHVEHVRAGRALRPASWPGGAKVAVALSFDSDHETPAAARRRRPARQDGAGRVRRPGRRPAHPEPAPAAQRAGVLLRARRVGAAARRRSPVLCGRRARSGAARLDPRTQHRAAPGPRSATSPSAPPTSSNAWRAPGRSASGRRPGTSPRTRSRIIARAGPAVRLVADGRRRLLRAARERRAHRRRRDAGGVDPRRRAVLHDGPLRRPCGPTRRRAAC